MVASYSGRPGRHPERRTNRRRARVRQMGNFGAEHTDWLFGTMDHYLRDGGSRGYLQKRRAMKQE